MNKVENGVMRADNVCVKGAIFLFAFLHILIIA